MKTVVMSLLAGVFFFAYGAELQYISSDELQTLISDSTIDYDYILIDVREDYEVEGGIIASDYCTPYHMSWSSGVLEDNYEKLPTDMRIIVYCRSGSRSGQAGNFLIGKEFANVISMSGGISSYPGDLADGSTVKSMDLLPEPSYRAHTTHTVFSPRVQSVTKASATVTKEQVWVTIDGRTATRVVSEAPVATQLLIHRSLKRGTKVMWRSHRR